MTRVGILSFAHMHAEGYAEILRRTEGIELVGFWDDDAGRRRRFGELYATRAFADPRELLDAGAEAVIVSSENARHRELVELAAAAGAHVLCEKPVGTTLEDSRALGRACEDAGVAFMTAFPMRFDPSARAVKAMLERGELGAVYAANGVNHAEMPSRHRAWFADPALAGGGAVMDHVVHLTDLLRWLLGAEPVEVYAEVGNPFHPDEVEVDTAGLATVAFDDGTFAAIDASWSRPPSYPRWGHLKLELFGERGAVTLDAFAQHLRAWSPDLPRTPSWVPWGGDPNQAMIEAFAAAVREGAPPPVSWRDGYQALRVALACYESAREGRVVELT